MLIGPWEILTLSSSSGDVKPSLMKRENFVGSFVGDDHLADDLSLIVQHPESRRDDRNSGLAGFSPLLLSASEWAYL